MRGVIFALGMAIVSGTMAAAPLPPQATPPSGQTLALNCVVCHGQGGKGEGAVPPLNSLSADKLAEAMAAYRDGSRRGTIMNRIAAGYSPDEDRLLGVYFAGRK